MKSLRLATIIALLGVLLSGCAGMQLGPNTTTGIGVGAIGGAILNRDNPAAGAIIGGAIGGAVGSAVDNDQGYHSGPVYGQPNYRRYDHCDWRCQDYRREQARRDAIRRAEVQRQLEWQEYCHYNWRRDYRCRR
jgi:hypothetical protein